MVKKKKESFNEVINMNNNGHFQDPIIIKLKKTLKSSIKNRSKYWQRQLNDEDKFNKMNENEIYNINSTGGWGNFTKKHFLKSYLHNLGLYYIFGNKLFNSHIYKMYKNIYDKFNRQIDYHVAKHILMLTLVERYIKNSKKMCVIGDGKLNFLLGANLLNPNSQLFYINLPEVLINDYLVMKEMKFLNGENIEVVEDLDAINYSNKTKLYLIPASQALFCNNLEIDFFFNSHSMQEMTYTEIEKYFNIIRSNNAFFYCNNREFKPGQVGDEDYFFEKMPWNNNKFLFKEKCPINKKYYNFKYPFIRKFDQFIHCLAKFN